eukprot:SAG22_NODE_172_length_16609_cov_14.370806_7_plen_62_part_00
MPSDSGSNHHSDVRGNPPTTSLSSTGTEIHNQTSTGESRGLLSQHKESLLMMVCPTGESAA